MKYTYSLIISIVIVSCAEIIQPTGGPPDKTPPEIISTDPKVGTTNIKPKKLSIRFSKFMDYKSHVKAISFQPNIDIDYTPKWKGKSLVIYINSEIPDSTTILMILNKNIQGWKGNKLKEPFTLAFSSGDKIDEFKLTAILKSAINGKPVQQGFVLLYRYPIDLSQKSIYGLQANQEGTINFSYLSQGTYLPIYVEDSNFNRMWDIGREHAQPFAVNKIVIDSTALDTLPELYITPPIDTIQPKLLSVGAISNHDLYLRFSESMAWTDTTLFSLKEELTDTTYNVQIMYEDPQKTNVIHAYVVQPLKDINYLLSISQMNDKNGNPIVIDTLLFEGTKQPNKKKNTYVKASSLGIFANKPIELIYSQPITSEADSLILYDDKTVLKNWGEAQVNLNKITVLPDTGWQEFAKYRILTYDPDSDEYIEITPIIWHKKDYGELELKTNDSTDTKYTAHLYALKYDIFYSKSIKNNTLWTDLPPMDYRLIIFKDVNNNELWDYGSIEPYIPPEFIHVTPKVEIKNKFTTFLSVKLK